MSWLYSQALVAEYLEESSLDGEQSALLNMSHMPLVYLPSDKMTDFSRLSRFGMTFEPLTESLGAELLTWFLAGFHARTLAQQEKAQGSKAIDQDSGWKWRESSVKYNQDMRLWKTRQFSLLEDSEWFSETWPRWGTMRDGECWELPMSERPTKGRESGLWQTPVADDAINRVSAQVLLPTPTATPYGSNKGGSMGREGQRERLSLNTMASSGMWPTPTVCGNYNRKGSSKTSGDGLATVVRRFHTPTVSMRKGASPGAMIRKSGKSRENDRLDYKIAGLDGHGGKLNPNWVEWLMGWLPGWTDLKPLETDKFRNALQKHGEY